VAVADGSYQTALMISDSVDLGAVGRDSSEL
jgi:hypothetical protein